MWIPDWMHYTFILVDEFALFCLTIFFIVTLSDLECDYLNPMTCCSRLNSWIVLEMVGASCITIVNLLNLHLFNFFLSIPLTLWLCKNVLLKPPGRLGVYDPLEIHNRQQLRSHMRTSMAKLGYHLVMLGIIAYGLVSSLITSEDLQVAES